MHILITGATRAQTGQTETQRVRYADVVDPLVIALKNLGHVVTRRSVVPGESLAEFDGMLCGIAPPTGLGSRYCFGWLYAVASELPRTYFIDDWQTHSMFSNIRSCGRSPQRMWNTDKKAFMQRDHWEVVEDREMLDRLLVGIERLCEPVYKQSVAAPMFSWGDHSLLRQGTPIVSLLPWDPSHDVLRYTRTHRMYWADRQRAWVIGTLSPTQSWREKLNLGWPVAAYGCRKEKQAKIQESELVEWYGQVRGTLVQPYRHCGSGWWRNRILFTAEQRSFLGADVREVTIPGYHISPKVFETLQDNDQRDLAENQRRSLVERITRPDEVLEQARVIVEAMS